MNKFTPGPWVADDAFMLDGNAVRVGTPFEGGRLYESVTICECWVRDESDEQDCEETGDSPDALTAEANARLIAAAPDLLKSLETLLVFMDPDSVMDQARDPHLRRDRDIAIALAQSAVRKARGVQP